MATQIVTVMFMAGAIPHVLTNGWVYFAFAYGINRLIITMIPIIPHVPAMVGNLIWGLALTSQIIIPFMKLHRTKRL